MYSLRGLLRAQRPLPQAELMYSFMEGGGARLLMVLDACRLDYFVKHMATLSDAGISRTVPAVSAGSCTREWFENTFVEPMRDVVYISANPKLSTKPLRDRLHRCFSKVIGVWRFAWNKKLGSSNLSIVHVAFPLRCISPSSIP